MPKWQALHAYLAGDQVIYRGVTYRATADFTSGAVFAISNWQAVADAPALTDVLPAFLKSPRTIPERLDGLNAQRYTALGAYMPLSPQTDALVARGNLILSVSPWVITEPTTLNGVWIDVTTAGNAGATYRPVLYADNGDGYPGQVVIDFGTLAADAVGRPTAACNVILEPGTYWLGGAVQNAATTAPIMSSTTSSWTPPVAMRMGTTTAPASRQSVVCYNATVTAGQVAPLTFPSTLLIGSNNARVGVFTGPAPKTPDAPLRWRAKPSTFFPTSASADGYVYGYFGEVGRAQVARTQDGGETFDLGFDFAGSLPTGQGVIWVGSLWNGTQWLYTVITSTSTTAASGGNGRIYNSRSLTSGYGARQLTHSINTLGIGRAVRYSNGKDIMIVGEYSVATPSIALDLWLTTDAGDTWTSIKQSTPTNTAKNSHWHTTAIDPTTFRIWASAGDEENSWFGYTDNLGGAWTNVQLATTDPLYDAVSVYVQPTVLCLFSGTGLYGAPDRSAMAAGLWRHDLTTGLPKPAYRLDTGVSTTGADAFARGPFVQTSGDVAIIGFPDKTLNAIPFIWFIGTGDRGVSWHSLGKVPLSGPDTGARPIVGPDSNGNVYWKSLGGPSPYGDNLLVAPLPVFA